MASKPGKPVLPNLEPYFAAGINPKTGLPFKLEEGDDCVDRAGIKKTLRILDEQNAVNRYTWYNLPCNLTSQELERLLYYRGQLAFFYLPALDEFFFMPYALDGTIDFYGRFNMIHPVPIATSGSSDDEKKQYEKQKDYLSTVRLKPLYDIPLEDVDPTEYCVLIHDYTKQESQAIIPRQRLQEPILDVMSDMIPFLRTALNNSTGVLGMRVNTQDEASNVIAANRSLTDAARKGRKYVPIKGNVEFQELTGDTPQRAEEFMEAMQSLDNYRLSLYGLDNGGLFQKKSHMLEAEQEMNQGNVNLVMNDGLSIRQHFCDVVNSIFGCDMWCDISEPVVNMDMNGDGMAMNDQDQSGSMPGEQPSGGDNYE